MAFLCFPSVGALRDEIAVADDTTPAIAFAGLSSPERSVRRTRRAQDLP